MTKTTVLLLLTAVAGCLLTVAVRTCTGKQDPDWWKKTIVYQLYIRSFQDSDGDGIGDLRGITRRLDHFKYMNIDTLWLTPFYRSPMVDFGYDIANNTDVDPIFGTMADFDDLIREAHKKGINIMVDFVPNHTSDQHKWFQESRKGKNNPYSDYYVWSDGILLENGTRVPPNNWNSVFSGPTWTWDPQREQFYLHQFTPEQPDLNLRNINVRKELENVLWFWLERGVDGFRMDAVEVIFEVTNLYLNEPRSGANVTSRDYDYLDHIYTRRQPELYIVMREWRNLFDKHDNITGKHTFVVTEIYDATYIASMKYYSAGADMPFNFNFIDINDKCFGACIKKLATDWFDHMPPGTWPNFVMGNHDRHRATARKGLQYGDALNVILLTLPGTPTTYYGEELAQNDIKVDYEDAQDPWGINVGPELYPIYGRDPCRGPLQWDDGPNSGFSSAIKTWLPVHPDYKCRNVEAQKRQGPISTLQIYRFCAKLRKRQEFRSSDYRFLDTNSDLFSFIRYNPQDPRYVYLVTANFGKHNTSDDHEFTLWGNNYTMGNVVLNTVTWDLVGQEIPLKNIVLRVGEAFIIKLSSAF